MHGFPTCAWDWLPVWETLGAKHSLIACDMLGFGLSDKPRTGYSIHRQADLQEALLRCVERAEKLAGSLATGAAH